MDRQVPTFYCDKSDMTLLRRISNFFGYPEFAKKYGHPYKDGYQISVEWQTGLGMGSTVGAIFGTCWERTDIHDAADTDAE